MSTDWDLHCPEHNDTTDLDWNHGDEALALLWRNRAPLLALPLDIFDPHQLEMNTNARPIGRALPFLRTHDQCRIELLNEYGDRKDVDTMEPVPPKHCKTCTCEPR